MVCVLSKVSEQAWVRVYRTEALADQDNKCRFCRSPIRVRVVTGDHLVPRSRGGQTTKKNIVAACLVCNQAKGSHTVGQFERMIRSPQAGQPIEVWLAWALRRISLATERSCARIMRAAR